MNIFLLKCYSKIEKFQEENAPNAISNFNFFRAPTMVAPPTRHLWQGAKIFQRKYNSLYEIILLYKKHLHHFPHAQGSNGPLATSTPGLLNSRANTIYPTPKLLLGGASSANKYHMPTKKCIRMLCRHTWSNESSNPTKAFYFWQDFILEHAPVLRSVDQPA